MPICELLFFFPLPRKKEPEIKKSKRPIHIHGCITGNSVGHQNFLSPRSCSSFFLPSFLSFFLLPGPWSYRQHRGFLCQRQVNCQKGLGIKKFYLPAHLIYASFRTRYSHRNVLHFIPCEYVVALHPKVPLPISDLSVLSSSSNGRRNMEKYSCSSSLVSVIKNSALRRVFRSVVFHYYLSKRKKKKKKEKEGQKPSGSDKLRLVIEYPGMLYSSLFFLSYKKKINKNGRMRSGTSSTLNSQ